MLMNINSWCHPHLGTVVCRGCGTFRWWSLALWGWAFGVCSLAPLPVGTPLPEMWSLSAFYSYCCAFPAIMDVWPAGTISKNKLLIAFGHGNWLQQRKVARSWDISLQQGFREGGCSWALRPYLAVFCVYLPQTHLLFSMPGEACVLSLV